MQDLGSYYREGIRMILQRHLDGKRKSLSIVGNWKEIGGNETILSINEQGHFKVVSKDGIELTGMFDITHHQEKRIEATIRDDNVKYGDRSGKESVKEKSVAWNQIIFTPSESFSTHRKKEEYQFWFNEKDNLVLYDDKNKVKELYKRITTEDTGDWQEKS
jgi:hypothetical protein